jgi:hypothetical protein
MTVTTKKVMMMLENNDQQRCFSKTVLTEHDQKKQTIPTL